MKNVFIKHRKFITLVLVVVLVIAVIVIIGQVNKTDPLDFTYNHSQGTVNNLQTGDYSNYKANTGYQNNPTIDNPILGDTEIKIDGTNFVETVTSTATEVIESVLSDGVTKRNLLLTSDTGVITYKIVIPEGKAGYYNLKLNYLTEVERSKSSSIERRMIVTISPKIQEEYEECIHLLTIDSTIKLVIGTEMAGGKENEVLASYKEYIESDYYKKATITEKKEQVLKYIKALPLMTEDKAQELVNIGFINYAYEEYMSNQSYVFSRIWKGDTAVLGSNDNEYDNYHKILNLATDNSGNDVKPSQVEVDGVYVSSYFSDYMGYVTEPYQYYLAEGDNYITLEAIKEYLLIDSIEVKSVETTPSYNQYLSDMLALHPATQQQVYSYRIEGEACDTTSSPTLYPITDRTSSNTFPYSAKTTKLNSIGGTNWKVLGDWIEWTFEVPEDGYYNISMRARQNLVRGMYSHRMVYIDGQIPFEELKSTVFSFSSDWQNVTLGSNEEDGGAFKFYLTKGSHTLRMEVTLGAYGELIEELEMVTQELSALYLNIIKYTTASPDTNRDYSLTKKEDLRLNERLQDAKTRLETLSKEIARLSSKNSDKEDTKGDGEIYKDGRSDKTGVIDTMVEQLDLFLSKSSKITKQLSSFSTNISSLGTLLSDLREFPLTLDYIVIYTAGVGDEESEYKMQKPNEGFFKKTWNSIVSFYYSFVIDYSEIGSAATDVDKSLEEIEIEVWMTLGRDQANVIRKLIDNDLAKRQFTLEDGRKVRISVNLKLTGTDVLLKAALAGVGPDVAINVDSGLPVNYGLRHATLDLAAAYGDEYWEFVEKNFLPSTIRQFTFNGSTYAVPEKQNYMMMFVRTDIMEEMYGDNWEDHVPTTWDEVRSIMTDLQTDQLQFYLPVNDAGASALNPAFVTMLYQNGGQLYSDDAKETGLLSDVAMNTFEYWTDFYTKYSFPKYASFINRFRSGEMPLGISYYEMYNTLAVFAPEIRGNWAFYPIPGTEIEVTDAANDPYGLSTTYPYTVVDHTSVASGTAAIIIEKNALADADVKWGAWEFLKWWTGEAQDEFGKEMEGILGSSARHATANYNSFVQLAWPKADQEALLKQWGYGDHDPSTGHAENDPNNFYLKVKEVTVPNSEKGTKYLQSDLYSYEIDGSGRFHVYGVREIPQIAGSYITGREVENAYRAVINNNYNAKETLYTYAQNINNEIDRKRSEFNLD